MAKPKGSVLVQGEEFFTNCLSSTFQNFHCPVRANVPPQSRSGALLAADIIVYQLSAFSGVAEASHALQILRDSTYEKPKTFILVSSVQTWAETKSQAALAAEVSGKDGDDEDEPDQEMFTEDMFHKRTPHPKYAAWKEVEKQAKEVNSAKLRTYIIFAGLLYGRGEDKLHPLFKLAWHLAPQGLPLFGSGRNLVPTVHVQDLCTFVARLSRRAEVPENDPEAEPEQPDERDPNQQYFFGVDQGVNSLAKIVRAINTSLGNGITHTVPERDFVLYENVEHFLINVRAEGAGMNTIMPEDEDWVAKNGFVESVDKVVQEFKEARGVTPLRISILGHPKSGKTTCAHKLAQHYKLPVITVAGVIEEFKNEELKLKTELQRLRQVRREQRKRAGEMDEEELDEEDLDDDGDDEDIEKIKTRLSDVSAILKMQIRKRAQIADDDDKPGRGGKKRPPPKKGKKEPEVVEKIEEPKEPEVVRYTDKCLAFMFRWKLDQPNCRNQGFILDNHPRTLAQAKLLLEEGELEIDDGEEENEKQPEISADEEPELKKVEERLLPANVIVLTASEEFLVQRAILEQKRETFDFAAVQSVAQYLESVLPNSDKPHIVRVGEFNVDDCPLTLPVVNATGVNGLDEVVADPLFDKLVEFVGEAHNYGLTPEEVQARVDKEKEKQRERERIKAEEAAQKRQREEEDRKALEARQKDEQTQLAAAQATEREMLEVRRLPLKNYLMENVIPLLTKGLIEVCEQQPNDPIDFLAEWLYKHNPSIDVV